ncbi:MAG: ADP-ribosylglycohydrolase family protein [Micrococcaceae bacterium]|nr:ADP-ribosylglycohydrolase family protein [Micrococcaceae bacterium]
MDNFSSRVAGVFYGGASAEAAAIDPEGTEFSTGTQLGLYVADGLLEVLEWASDGQAADPPAAVWLALLRWYKNRYGDVPDGLPAPLDRWLDTHPVTSGVVDDTTKTGLEETEMGTPRKPHGTDSDGADALVRSAPFGMIPQVDAEWVLKMSQQAAVLTHGSWHAPAAFSLLIHHIIAGKTLFSAVTDVLAWLNEHDGTELAERIRAGLSDSVNTPMTAHEVLAAAIRAVADALEQPVAPEQLYAAAVTNAVNFGGNTRPTALLAGQLMGGLLGQSGTNSPTHLDQFDVLEEVVERWLKLTV